MGKAEGGMGKAEGGNAEWRKLQGSFMTPFFPCLAPIAGRVGFD